MLLSIVILAPVRTTEPPQYCATATPSPAGVSDSYRIFTLRQTPLVFWAK